MKYKIICFLCDRALWRSETEFTLFWLPHSAVDEEKDAFYKGMYELKSLVKTETANWLARLKMGGTEHMEFRMKKICAATIYRVMELYLDKDDIDDINFICGKCKELFDELSANHEKFTDTINKFCEYLKKRGRLYYSEETMQDLFLNLVSAQAFNEDIYDDLTGKQLIELDTCEHISAAIIEAGMSAGKAHHDIWTACQAKLNGRNDLTKIFNE